MLAVFVSNASFSATAVGLPAIEHSLDLHFSGLQWTMTAYLVAFAATLLVGGRLGDALGLRTVFVAGLVVYLVSVLVVATAQDVTVLLGGRALQGVAAGLITPATTSLARSRFSGTSMTAALGLVIGMSAIGQAAGPPLGGVLVEELGWRSVFYLIAPFLVVSLVLAWTSIDPDEPPVSRHVDVLGALLFAASLAATTIGLTEGGDYGYSSPYVVAAFVCAVVAFVLFRRRLRRPGAIVDVGLLRSRTFVVSLLVGFTMTLAFASLVFFEALYLEKARGYGAIRTGLVFLPMTAVFGLLSTQANRIERLFGHRSAAVGGLALAAAGTLVLALDSPGVTIAQPLVGLLLIGVGLGACWAQVTTVGLQAVPAAEAGQASGILFTGRWFGGAVGVAVLGVLYRTVADDRLDTRLDRIRVHLGPARRADLTGLLAGTTTGRHALAALPAAARAPGVAAVHDAAAYGTGWALAAVAAVTLCGSLLCLRFPARRAAVPAAVATAATASRA